jgi:hypothetical protein
LVERALDFYSRVGIGQFDVIKEHPTFESYLYEVCTPNKVPDVGDRTPQGEILEVKDGKALINGSVSEETGHWCDTPVWKKLEDVKLSTNYTRYHEIRDNVDLMFFNPEICYLMILLYLNTPVGEFITNMWMIHVECHLIWYK